MVVNSNYFSIYFTIIFFQICLDPHSFTLIFNLVFFYFLCHSHYMISRMKNFNDFYKLSNFSHHLITKATSFYCFFTFYDFKSQFQIYNYLTHNNPFNIEIYLFFNHINFQTCLFLHVQSFLNLTYQLIPFQMNCHHMIIILSYHKIWSLSTLNLYPFSLFIFLQIFYPYHLIIIP